MMKTWLCAIGATLLLALALAGCRQEGNDPSPGSTGDGYRFARENGHSVVPPSASLVGLTVEEKWPALLQVRVCVMSMLQRVWFSGQRITRRLAV